MVFYKVSHSTTAPLEQIRVKCLSEGHINCLFFFPLQWLLLGVGSYLNVQRIACILSGTLLVMRKRDFDAGDYGRLSSGSESKTLQSMTVVRCKVRGVTLQWESGVHSVCLYS